MKKCSLFFLLCLSCQSFGADVLQVNDNIGLEFLQSERHLIQTMTETEKLREGLVLRILEAIDGKQTETTNEHESAVQEAAGAAAPALSPLQSYTTAKSDFYDTLSTDAYELKYTPASDDYNAVQTHLRQMFFLPACYDYMSDEEKESLDIKEKEASKNNVILWRQEYLSDIALVSLDFANEIYKNAKTDADNFPTKEGGLCLKEDLQLTIQYYQRLCQKMVVDIALQMRQLELQAAFLLQDLPVQEQLPPIYRQSEAERLKRIKNPSFNMQNYLTEKWCKDKKTWE